MGLAEAEAREKAQRALVAGIDVGGEGLQAPHAEHPPDHRLQRFSRQALAPEGRMQDVADLGQPPAAGLADGAALELDDEVVADLLGRLDHRLDEPAGLLQAGMRRRRPVAHRLGVSEHPVKRRGVRGFGPPQS